MMETVTLPRAVFETLRAGYIGAVARRLTTAMPDGGRKRRAPLHPGDDFGRVLVWAWGFDRVEAMRFLADQLVDLHGVDEREPRASLEDLQRGLRLAIPPGFSDYDELVVWARRKVPSLYGDPAV